eukprot:gene8854-biopygen5446
MGHDDGSRAMLRLSFAGALLDDGGEVAVRLMCPRRSQITDVQAWVIVKLQAMAIWNAGKCLSGSVGMPPPAESKDTLIRPPVGRRSARRK